MKATKRARRTNAVTGPDAAAGPERPVRVQFHGLMSGGDGVGRDQSGRAVFAPRAAPGDIALVEIERQYKGYARGRLARLETASAARVAPPCPFYAPADVLPLSSPPAPSLPALRVACGGCQWQHIEYAAQLEAKRALVREALRRIGGLGDAARDAVEPCVPSPAPFAYRNKAEFVVAPAPESLEPPEEFAGDSTDAEAWRIGFFARESHRVVDITHCLIQQEPNNALLRAVRGALNAGLATPFNPATGEGTLRRLTTRASSGGESLLIAETTDGPWSQAAAFAAHVRAAVPSLVGVLWRRAQSREGFRNGFQPAQLIDPASGGRDWLEESVGGLRLRVTGDSFFQVNTALTPALVETALRLAEVGPGSRALDVFCGVGLFALAMAQAGACVTGIEANRAAVRDARDNAARNRLDAAFREGDAAREMNRLARASATVRASPREPLPDVVALDPPRAGAATCVPALVRLRPRRIIYVSCDPATLARDVRALAAGGYRLRRAVPLDLFPQTARVETVAQLALAG